MATATSRAEIETIVARYGAQQFSSGWDSTGGVAMIQFLVDTRRVRFVLHLPTATDAPTKVARAWGGQGKPARIAEWISHEERRRWRCLLLAIKAKLEVVATGISTFEEEFLAHIVTDDDRTIYDRIRDPRAKLLLLGPSPAVSP